MSDKPIHQWVKFKKVRSRPEVKPGEWTLAQIWGGYPIGGVYVYAADHVLSRKDIAVYGPIVALPAQV